MMNVTPGRTPPSNAPRRKRQNAATCQLLVNAMPVKTAPQENIKKDSHHRGAILVSTQFDGTSVRKYEGKN
jgi:hypothetical protein